MMTFVGETKEEEVMMVLGILVEMDTRPWCIILGILGVMASIGWRTNDCRSFYSL